MLYNEMKVNEYIYEENKKNSREVYSEESIPKLSEDKSFWKVTKKIIGFGRVVLPCTWFYWISQEPLNSQW